MFEIEILRGRDGRETRHDAAGSAKVATGVTKRLFGAIWLAACLGMAVVDVRAQDGALRRALAGTWASGTDRLEIKVRDRRLLLDDGISVAKVAASGDHSVDDAGRRRPLAVVGDRLVHDGGVWNRSDARPAECPPEWRPLLGDFGGDRREATVGEWYGRLRLIAADGKAAFLEQLADGTWRLGDQKGKPAKLRFIRDAEGVVVALVQSGKRLPSRSGGRVEDGSFRIVPQRDVATLRAEARLAAPPHEATPRQPPRLVDLATVDAGLRFDIRYAGIDNFMGERFYDEPRAFLQEPAAKALTRAAAALRKQGLGLLIHDAYRPWFVTYMFWHATPSSQRDYVADPAKGSRHNRGCAVDLTLCDLTSGTPLPMPSGYDEFSERAWPDYPGGTTLERRHRDLLRAAMEAVGFTVYSVEWWHYDFSDWRSWPILNLPFSAIKPAGH